MQKAKYKVGDTLVKMFDRNDVGGIGRIVKIISVESISYGGGFRYASYVGNGHFHTESWTQDYLDENFKLQVNEIVRGSTIREYTSGMIRDTQQGKPRYDLCYKEMYKRWAELMARGAEQYGEDNWKKANGEPELKDFKASAERHFQQWMNGETDEDHAAAVFFNISGYEYVKTKLNVPETQKKDGN